MRELDAPDALADAETNVDVESEQAPRRRGRGTRQWSDLSTGQKRAVIAVGAAQAALMAAAEIDLIRRPADAVRGPKPVWFAANLVNFVGPASYFAIGRRRAHGTDR